MLAAGAAALLAAGCGTTVSLPPSKPGPAVVSSGSDGLAVAPDATGGGDSATAPPAVPTLAGHPSGQAPAQASPATTRDGGRGEASSGKPHGGTKLSATPRGPLVTTPIQIGFLAAGASNTVLSSIGAHSGTTETPQDAMAFFVKKLNASGGLNGRRVEIIQDFINPASANYDTQASAACADFTQDHHVAAVFAIEGYFYSREFSACLAHAGVPELLAVSGGVDPSALREYPTLFSTTAPTVERRFAALVNGLSSNGYLTSKDKVGVVVEDCPYNKTAYSSTVAPMLKARGISVIERQVSCVHGFVDAASFILSMGQQVLPFKAAHVNRVMFLSGFESIAAQYFEKQAASQKYAPHYALTSAASIGDGAIGFSGAALRRVQGVGWEPDLDVTHLAHGSPATQRCERMWKGFAPATARSNRQTNDTTCEEFFVLEKALQLTRGDSSAAALEAAIQNIGSAYTSPMMLNGVTGYRPGHKEAPRLFATFGWKAGCGCIAYTGAPRPLA
jgi:ABC-type branched-subunit amino acid transport system substrate-binding protein